MSVAVAVAVAVLGILAGRSRACCWGHGRSGGFRGWFRCGFRWIPMWFPLGSEAGSLGSSLAVAVLGILAGRSRACCWAGRGQCARHTRGDWVPSISGA